MQHYLKSDLRRTFLCYLAIDRINLCTVHTYSTYNIGQSRVIPTALNPFGVSWARVGTSCTKFKK